jgi:hypothetical protein
MFPIEGAAAPVGLRKKANEPACSDIPGNTSAEPKNDAAAGGFMSSRRE